IPSRVVARRGSFRAGCLQSAVEGAAFRGSVARGRHRAAPFSSIELTPDEPGSEILGSGAGGSPETPRLGGRDRLRNAGPACPGPALCPPPRGRRNARGQDQPLRATLSAGE